jgi:D-apionolactonase
MTADDLLKTFGSDQPLKAGVPVAAGPVALLIADGDMRRLQFGGVEVLRRLSYPIRDEDWGTAATLTVSETIQETGAGLGYTRAFGSADGALTGRFRLDAEGADGGATVKAQLEITALRDVRVSRCGFTLLHPIADVRGEPLTVSHPDGTKTRTTFPGLIRPDQPARAITGLTHVVGGVSVDIGLNGDVFEMEDQRNWSDASFKTYCRPLSLPRPYVLAAGEVVRQEIRITLSGNPAAMALVRAATAARMPEMALAHEPGISWAAGVRGLEGMALLLRVRADATRDALARAVSAAGQVTLEMVLPKAADAAEGLAGLARTCAAAGLAPVRVVGVLEAYLASHQPEGPWPEGPRPDDLAAVLAQAFPGAEVGAGSLTNFTELNRCRPDMRAAKFLTFGSSAIVHAADDMSVIETLEALPDIFVSARTLSGGKPMRLGLVSIGMRSNPYGGAVAVNPGLTRTPMAMVDPRQDGLFAAAWAVGVLAAAAEGGVASLALAMTDGPLGVLGPVGAFRPVYHVIRAAHVMAGAELTVTRHGMIVTLAGGGRMIAANIGSAPTALDLPAGHPARILSQASFAMASANPDWTLHAEHHTGSVAIPAFAVAFGGFGDG